MHDLDVAGDRPSAARIPPSRALLLVVLLGLLLGIPVQAARGLYRPDEGRYTAVALRMLDTGDWVHPQLEHEHEHYTKPPLTYWALAASMALLGRNEFAARLPNALALLATIALLWVAARRLQPRRAWLAPALYAVCAFPRIAAGVVTTDTLLTMFTTMTLAGFVAWRFDPARPAGFLLLMWLGVALGFLTKGPPSLLVLLSILVFCVWQDGWRGLVRLRWILGLGLFLALGLGWYVLVVAGQPELLETFLRREVADRLFSGAHRRNADPVHVLDVYLPALVLGTFPWTWQALQGVGRALREARHADARLLLLCLLLPTAVFCFVPSRLPLYVLQVFPAFMLLTARGAPDTFLQGRRTPLVLAVLIVGGAAAFVAVRWYPTSYDSRPLARTLEAHVPFSPREVLFFDAPHRGLALYLGCEVEAIELHAPPGGRRHGLEQELAEDEARRIFCVQASLREPFEAEIARLGVPVRRLGTWRELGIYCLLRDLPPGAGG